ncbi:MAG: M61 family metallopeptidase [Acidobacteriota bacterium]|nr:M61 family metallopeptidase [Acidobacteriota bacterium]
MHQISWRGWLAAATIFFALVPSAQAAINVTLDVDATQTPEKILHVRETIPVTPGDAVIYYPKWIPGEHGPDGPISTVTGLHFYAAGKDLTWHRDLVDVFTFHVEVPAGVNSIEAKFDEIEPEGYSATDKLMVLEWNQVTLYPAGTPAQEQNFKASLKLPTGWKYGTPLHIASTDGDTIHFKPVSLNRLVDSPIMAGQYYRAIDITPAGEPIHHELDLVADSAVALNISDKTRKEMTQLVAESGMLFGARHYTQYHFLLALSDHVAHFGLEHHESNDSRLPERTLIGSNPGADLGGLLAHEFVHSWNGKFRRPADLSTPYYEEPEKTDLLWGYEGLTDYLGPLLAARSGLWSPKEYEQYLAGIAASLGPGRPGRTWRPLIDTATGEPGIHARGGWFNWIRGTDYYDEGDLLWLEVATIIAKQTDGKKSIDDFCQSFHGGSNNGPELKPYTFEQLTAALNAIAPYDWAKFFTERLESKSAAAPTGGIENAGWKLVFTSEEQKPFGHDVPPADNYSIGLQLRPDGTVADSIVGSPAYQAGITSNMKVLAVNSRLFKPDYLTDAIKASKDSTEPITLLVVNDEYVRAAKIDYHGGERFPHLVRNESVPDGMAALIKPRAAAE